MTSLACCRKPRRLGGGLGGEGRLSKPLKPKNARKKPVQAYMQKLQEDARYSVLRWVCFLIVGFGFKGVLHSSCGVVAGQGTVWTAIWKASCRDSGHYITMSYHLS
jgi:hypothetical protein